MKTTGIITVYLQGLTVPDNHAVTLDLATGNVSGRLPQGQPLLIKLPFSNITLPIALKPGTADYAIADLSCLRQAQLVAAVQLREKAAELMQAAENMDGLRPYLVQHEHRHGIDVNLCWVKGLPDDETVVRILDIDFDPELGESLQVDGASVDDLTGICGYRDAEKNAEFTAPETAPAP